MPTYMHEAEMGYPDARQTFEVIQDVREDRRVAFEGLSRYNRVVYGSYARAAGSSGPKTFHKS